VQLAQRLEKPWLYILHGVLSIFSVIPINLIGILFSYTHAWLAVFFFVVFATAICLTILHNGMTTRAYQLARLASGDQREVGEKGLEDS